MLYYLAILLVPFFDLVNVLTYHTVRAGGAVFTAFLVTILSGPFVIGKLRELKIGQFIKKDYVPDLHQLHKGKAGTPTMGGIMIIFSTLLTLIIWGRLDNRLLWLSLFVFLTLGLLGGADDYIKLRKRHNDGLTPRQKMIGQALIGLILGVYLYFFPVTPGATYFSLSDVKDWQLLQQYVSQGLKENNNSKEIRIIFSSLQQDLRQHLLNLNYDSELQVEEQLLILRALNQLIDKPEWKNRHTWLGKDLREETKYYLSLEKPKIPNQTQRLGRLIIEDVFKGAFYLSKSDLHTSVGVPGFKNLFISLGVIYIFFVVLVIMSMSNAVNLTDGLDGLAIGSSTISIMAYAAIAYIVSRADWSRYLFITYVPEASELFVFGSALLGAGLGFLWYNCHPAEVFMGDTGSLSLGGAIGTMALLTKQELLLPLVAGIFVLEAGSVVLQVASFKLTGKRIFRMSPLHHHFELLGWSETKVTLRFWIIALLFALLSLGTLKLR
ncbi:MAG: phospho-N-acetylmuramoyl-pentapeptide-transferase [Candidatus Hydrogenedentes bacterium]|nr:phospho-N-acetylmuramoyl-pentapeptide-transferase [Candidatus Hydrogenedentota bacterium]